RPLLCHGSPLVWPPGGHDRMITDPARGPWPRRDARSLHPRTSVGALQGRLLAHGPARCLLAPGPDGSFRKAGGGLFAPPSDEAKRQGRAPDPGRGLVVMRRGAPRVPSGGMVSDVSVEARAL